MKFLTVALLLAVGFSALNVSAADDGKQHASAKNKKVTDPDAVADVSAREPSSLNDLLKALQTPGKFNIEVVKALFKFVRDVMAEIQVINDIAENIKNKDLGDVVKKLQDLIKKPDAGLEHYIKILLKTLPPNHPKDLVSSVITAVIKGKLDELLQAINIFGEQGVRKELLVYLVEKVLHLDKSTAAFIVENVKVKVDPSLVTMVVQKILETLPKGSVLVNEGRSIS